MTTTFNITCSNWTDRDPPIKYDYAYEFNGVRTVFLTRTGSPGETVISSSDLPIGNSNRDNDLDIYVNIRDKFDGTTELYFTVKVVIMCIVTTTSRNIQLPKNSPLIFRTISQISFS